MLYSYSKLKGRIVEKFSSQRQFAKKLGISEISLSRKMTCKTGFSQADIIKWSDMLDINPSEYAEYFFN